jgi:TRAP-type transport system periplasmic protein
MTIITRRNLLATATAGAGLLFAPAIVGRAQAQTTLTVASLLGEDKP